MSKTPARSVRRTAGAAVLVLVAGGAAMVSAPATAVSATLSYDCTTPLGPRVFTAVIDTDAPATLLPGQSASISTTSKVTVPADVVDALRTFYGAASVDGTADATGTVNGANRATLLTIAKAAVPVAAGSTMVLTGIGPSGSLAAAPVGSVYELGAGPFTAHINGYKADGSSTGAPVDIPCSLQAGQNLHVDTVTVVAAPTTTTLSIASPVSYGDTATVTADVALTSGNAKPDGSVAFTLAGKTVSMTVKGGKAKATLPAALTMGVQAVTAVFTPTSKDVAGSQAAKNVTVVRDQTSSTAAVTYRAARHRLVAKDKVVADHGTAVTGQVRLVVKRDGVRLRSAVVSVNKFGAARKVFKRIGKPGAYTVVARYLGSPTLARSVDRVKTTI